MEYIAGRPFNVNGGNVEPGDRMTKEQMDSIPYVESFISSGYIYPVYTDKDYDRLPPHIFTTVMQRREAEFAMKQRTAYETEEQRANQEAGDADLSREEAARQAEIDAGHNQMLRKYVRKVDPAEVKTKEEDTKERDAAIKEAEEKENVLSIPDQTPADEKDSDPVVDDKTVTPVPVEEPKASKGK